MVLLNHLSENLIPSETGSGVFSITGSATGSGAAGSATGSGGGCSTSRSISMNLCHETVGFGEP